MLVPPIYPKDAEERKVEGNVELHIHITTMGTVDQVLVIKSSGWDSMDKAAMKAAQKTLFRPAVKGGEHVPMWINYHIQFALNKAR